MAGIDLDIGIHKPVKVMVYELEVSVTLECVTKGYYVIENPGPFLINNQFFIRNQSSWCW